MLFCCVFLENVRWFAEKTNNEYLIETLNKGTLRSQKRKYHFNCLRNIQNAARSKSSSSFQICYGLAISDLVSYIRQKMAESKIVCYFYIKDLVKKIR